MSNNIDIKIKAKTEGSQEIKKLEQDLSALGKIDAFKKLKKDVEASKTAWTKAQAEVAKLAKEIQATDKPTKALSRNFEAAKKKASSLKNAFLQNRESLNTLRTSLQKAGVGTTQLSDSQAKLQKSLAQTRQELTKAAKFNAARGMLDVKPYKEVEAEIDRLKAAYKTLAGSGKLSSAELYQAQVQLKKKTAELRKETAGWSSDMAMAGGSIAGAAAAGYALMQSFNVYSDFSQRMAEVNTLLDVSSKKFTSLSDEILTMTQRIPQTASELAAAEYDIISAGVALENSTRVLELSAKAAVAGVTDTKTAVNIGVGVINAYGKSIGELDDVYDILFQTVKSGVTTFPELSQNIGDVLPSARAAGVEFKDVAASIAAMTKAGIQTPRAATALKGAINAMAAPAPEAKKKFDALGITWEGLIPTLEAIRKKSLSVDQMRLLIPDTEARTGVLALTQNMGDLKKILDGMDDSAGSMQTAYDKMADTPENQIKLFKNEISKLGVELGGTVSIGLLPAIKFLRGFKQAVTPTTIELAGLKVEANRTIKELKEFKDVRLPDDIVGRTPEELEKFNEELLKSKAYYEALQTKLKAQANEISIFGNATDDAIAAQKELKIVDQRLDEINGDLKRLKGAGETAAEGMKKPVEVVKATEAQLESFEKEAKQAYQNARSEAKKYAEEVLRWEEKIKYARMSTEDKIRELGRKGLTEEEQWNDKRKQADEKLYAAKEALRKKDYELAEKLAQDAESLYADLATEVKKTKGGEDVVVKSMEASKKVAIDGVREVGNFTRQLYDEQKQNAEKTRNQWTETAKNIKYQLDEIVQQREANIQVELKGVTDAQNEINDLIRDETKHIKIEVTKEVKTVEKKQTGGPILHASSGRFIRRPHGRLPGESKIDSVPVLARPGEWFINNEAGRYWNQLFGGFMHGINNPMSSLGQRIKAAMVNGMPKKMSIGGIVNEKVGGLMSNLTIPEIPVPRFATGGSVPSLNTQDLGRLEIAIGNTAFPVLARPDVVKELKSALNREKLLRNN